MFVFVAVCFLVCATEEDCAKSLTCVRDLNDHEFGYSIIGSLFIIIYLVVDGIFCQH